jgi:hypothetical protein
MAVTSAARRPGRLVALWLLTAMLAALGVSGPLHVTGPAPASSEPRGAGVVVGSSAAEAVPPVGAAGRPVAAPSLVYVHGPAEPLPCGATPSVAAPTPAPMRLGDQHTDVTSAALAVRRSTAGERAPPVRQVDL